MPKTWFRVHAGGPSSILDNRKIQTLPPIEFKWLINLWALACGREGILPSIEDIAWRLHVSTAVVQTSLSKLVAKRFVERQGDGYIIHDWSEHQFESDTSTKRVRAFRERQRNVSGNENGNVSETPLARTDTRSESVSESVSVSVSVEGVQGKPVKSPIDDSDFREYISVFLAHDKRLNEADVAKACRVWVGLDDEERRAALDGVKAESAGEWRTRTSGNHIPHPQRYLAEKHWTRQSPGRLVPKVTRGEQLAQERNSELRKWAQEES